MFKDWKNKSFKVKNEFLTKWNFGDLICKFRIQIWILLATLEVHWEDIWLTYTSKKKIGCMRGCVTLVKVVWPPLSLSLGRSAHTHAYMCVVTCFWYTTWVRFRSLSHKHSLVFCGERNKIKQGFSRSVLAHFLSLSLALGSEPPPPLVCWFCMFNLAIEDPWSC